MSIKRAFILTAIIFFFIAQPALARSGCCSHHGGVMSNGCGCNDGTPLSDTCAPYYACTAGSTETAPIQTTLPTSTPYIRPTAIPTRVPTRIPTKIPTKTPTPTLTLTPTPTLTVTPTPERKVAAPTTQTPKHSGFWGFFLSLFGMNKQ